MHFVPGILCIFLVAGSHDRDKRVHWMKRKICNFIFRKKKYMLATCLGMICLCNQVLHNTSQTKAFWFWFCLCLFFFSFLSFFLKSCQLSATDIQQGKNKTNKNIYSLLTMDILNSFDGAHRHNTTSSIW